MPWAWRAGPRCRVGGLTTSAHREFVTPTSVIAQRAGLVIRVHWHHTKRNAQTHKMTTTKILKSLLIAALLSSVAHAAEQTIVIALEEGKQVASFKVGDSSCVLKDDQIRCAPASK